MTQALAILQDSIRELRSRSLFWVSLGISAVVAVALFGMISFNEEGMRILWFETQENESLRAGSLGARDLMTWMYSGFYVFWWLSWGAIILAVVSTASILPGFLSSGAIELALAKPISRLRMYVLKILGALLFVTVQTALGVVLAFVLLGWRGDVWLPAVLWAIPLIIVQFFYLYSVSALVAVVTRSTLASLLITMVFWVLVSLLQFSSNQMDELMASNERMIARADERIATIRERATAEGRELNAFEQGRISGQEAGKEPFQKQIDFVAPYQKPLTTAELIVPKTGDVQKIIANLNEAPTFNELMRTLGGDASIRPADFSEDDWEAMMDASEQGKRAVRNVDAVKSIGSSLGFSLVVLALGAVVFVRRDF